MPDLSAVRAIYQLSLLKHHRREGRIADGVDGSCSNQRRDALYCRCRNLLMRGATPWKLPQSA